MTLEETTKIYYSIYLYKYQDYPCLKYKYNLPKTFNSAVVSFFNKNKFNLQELSTYPKQVIILKSIISIFLYNKGRVVPIISQKEFDSFVFDIQYYENEFDIFIRKFTEQKEFKITSYKDLYLLFTQRKIKFYIFYYMLKYVRFKEGFNSQELIKNKFLEVHKMMEFFKYFDEKKIQEKLKEVQKIIMLIEN